MDRVFLFFVRNDVWIYIVCAFGLFWYVTEFVRAQRRLRQAMFSLERETSSQVRNNALTFILFFGAIAGFTYYVNASIAPGLPEELLVPATATPDIFSTPLVPPTPLSGTNSDPDSGGLPADGPAPAPTVTLPPELGGPIPEPDIVTDTTSIEATLTPEVIGTPFVGCQPELLFTSPLDGSVAFSMVEFVGTANTGETHLYTIELNGPQTEGAWAPLFETPAAQPIVEAALGTADLSAWSDGPYLARLRAIDRAGVEVGQCVIQFTLDNR